MAPSPWQQSRGETQPRRPSLPPGGRPAPGETHRSPPAGGPAPPPPAAGGVPGAAPPSPQRRFGAPASLRCPAGTAGAKLTWDAGKAGEFNLANGRPHTTELSCDWRSGRWFAQQKKRSLRQEDRGGASKEAGGEAKGENEERTGRGRPGSRGFRNVAGIIAVPPGTGARLAPSREENRPSESWVIQADALSQRCSASGSSSSNTGIGATLPDQ